MHGMIESQEIVCAVSVFSFNDVAVYGYGHNIIQVVAPQSKVLPGKDHKYGVYT